MIEAITSSALAGLESAKQRANESARNIANAGSGASDTDLVRDIVDLNVAELEFSANIATLETAQELSEELGRLFDRRV